MRESRLMLQLRDEDATQEVGSLLAQSIPLESNHLLLTLEGELGAGKTTLARAVLRALGVIGPVRSPTYTLLEPYETAAGKVLHFDLYRLAGGDELEALGYRDLREGSLLTLVEWPDRGGWALGKADLAAELAYEEQGRRLVLRAETPVGRDWLERFYRQVPAAWSG